LEERKRAPCDTPPLTGGDLKRQVGLPRPGVEAPVRRFANIALMVAGFGIVVLVLTGRLSPGDLPRQIMATAAGTFLGVRRLLVLLGDLRGDVE
jgi:hypothetical protein